MTVYLVGAGPGDPELLTVKAARLLGAADVVLYDRLVGEGLLALCRPDAELIDVGKRPGGSHTQELLNDLLVQVGRKHQTVVRLKGGDPFVFGRGGEEVEVLAAAGIDVEVVPGISSAFAGPAAAGIPVTHRGIARSVTVVTGHELAQSDAVDWRALGKVGGTIVVLMGVERRALLAERLMEGGLSGSTPVAVVHEATLATQSTLTGRLDELASLDAVSPAVIVIGAVAAFPAGLQALAGAVRQGGDLHR
jgi:uroporphyrin-III C-methyltransferase